MAPSSEVNPRPAPPAPEASVRASPNFAASAARQGTAAPLYITRRARRAAAGGGAGLAKDRSHDREATGDGDPRYLSRCPGRAATRPGSPHSLPESGSAHPRPPTRIPSYFFLPSAAERARAAPPSRRLGLPAPGPLQLRRWCRRVARPPREPGRRKIAARTARAQLGPRVGAWPTRNWRRRRREREGRREGGTAAAQPRARTRPADRAPPFSRWPRLLPVA